MRKYSGMWDPESCRNIVGITVGDLWVILRYCCILQWWQGYEVLEEQILQRHEYAKNLAQISSILKFFFEYVTAIDFSRNMFCGDGHFLLLKLLNIVLIEVDMLEEFGCGRFIPVNAGAVVILNQGELLWLYHLKVAGMETNGQGVLKSFICHHGYGFFWAKSYVAILDGLLRD